MSLPGSRITHHVAAFLGSCSTVPAGYDKMPGTTGSASLVVGNVRQGDVLLQRGGQWRLDFPRIPDPGCSFG